MPTYSYYCDSCKKDFELFFYIKDYVENPICEECKHSTSRLYAKDVLTQTSSVKKSDSELKTLGDLALRNSDRMSSDEKIALEKKHNAYRDIDDKPLPKGMSRVKKPPKPKWKFYE